MNLFLVLQIGFIIVTWDINTLFSRSSVSLASATQQLRRFDPTEELGIDFKKIPIVVKTVAKYTSPSYKYREGKTMKLIKPKYKIQPRRRPRYYKQKPMLKEYVHYSLAPSKYFKKYRSTHRRYPKYYRPSPKMKIYRYTKPYVPEIRYMEAEPYFDDESYDPMMSYEPDFEPEWHNEIGEMYFDPEKPMDYKQPYYPDVYGEYNAEFDQNKRTSLKLHETLVNNNFFKAVPRYPDSDNAYSENYFNAFPVINRVARNTEDDSNAGRSITKLYSTNRPFPTLQASKLHW